MEKISKVCLLTMCLIFCSFVAYAAEDSFNKKINIQGKLTTDSGQPITGSQKVTLSIYSDSAGQNRVGGGEQDNVNVDSDGIYNANIEIGNVSFKDQRYFKVKAGNVESTVTPFSASPNAFYASTATYALSLDPNGDPLQNGNFGSGEYTINVTNAMKVSTQTAVYVTKGFVWGIVDDNHTQAWTNDIALNVSTASYAESIANGCVTTSKIVNANVTSSKLADGSVTSVKIGSNAVTTAKISNNAVTTAKIADANVTPAKLTQKDYTNKYLIKVDSAVWADNAGTTITAISAEKDSNGNNIVNTYATKEQLNTKISSNSAITGATKTKITYDNKGLVTGGADLVAADIPSLASSKITAMTDYAKASEASAIATNDSLNVAIGKLEKGLDDAKISNPSNDNKISLNSDTEKNYIWGYNGNKQGWFKLSDSDGKTVINGADLAEMYQSTEKLVPGDVVSIDTTKDNAIVKTKVAEDTLVAGVISTEPGVLMNQNEKGYKLALVGKVPTKVCNEGGAIKRGDLLVSASIPGYAKKAGDNPKVGTVIGKALENLDSQKGTILVLVNLQ